MHNEIFNTGIVFKICSKCHMVVASYTNNGQGAEWFYLNGVEIFEYVYNLSRLNLTCDEIIIKNIIE